MSCYDRIIYCDVIDHCEDCPRYGDDCDGDKRGDDLISRADAIEAVGNANPIDKEYHYYKHIALDAIKALPSAETTGALDDAIAKYVADGLMELPSAEGGDAQMNEIKNPYYMKPCPDNGADLISRADAIRWVKTECNPYGKPTLDYDSGLKVIEHLKKMPSVEDEWIPCNKRLPKAEYGESDCVLATCCWKTDTQKRWIKKLYFNGGNWCYPTGEYFTEKVIAWMPLPKPYKGGDTE